MTADALRSDCHAPHYSTIAAFADYSSKQYIQTDVAPYAMTSPIPDRLGSAKAKLAELGRLEPGWNSDEAKSISAVARTPADLLRQLASTHTPRPTLVPTSDGLVPDWLGSAEAKLAEFGELEPGWNSYEAKSISAVARTAAYDLLRQLASTRTPRPTLVPTSDGLVQIEWHTRGVDLEIRVLSLTKMNISFEDSRGALSPIEGEFQYDMRELGAAMQVLSNR